jgi:hypothetical protein
MASDWRADGQVPACTRVHQRPGPPLEAGSRPLQTAIFRIRADLVTKELQLAKALTRDQPVV